MEAPDDRDRVRPLPPESDTREERRTPDVRAVVPMLVGAIVLIGFIIVIALGSAPSVEPEAGAGDATTTPTFIRDRTAIVGTEETVEPTTTIPVPTTIVTREAPLLGDVLPEFDQGFNVVVEDASGNPAVARWRLNRRFPRFIDLPEGPGTSGFDASGTLVANVGTGSTSANSGLLSVGPAASGASAAFVEAESFRWHDTTPGLLALTGRLPDENTPGLYLLDFNAAGRLLGVERLRDAGPTWQVIGFHDDRVAVVDNGVELPTLQLVDMAGDVIASAQGAATLTSTSVLIGVGPTEIGVATRAWDWDLDELAEPPRFLDRALPEIISPDGRHGVSIVRASTSTVEIRSQDLAVPRSIGVAAPITEAVFFTNEHIAVFSEIAGKLFVIEWRSGTIHEFLLEGRTVRAAAAPGHARPDETAP